MTNDIRQRVRQLVTDGSNNVAILADVNAGPIGYEDVKAVSVAQWLGENALREKIDIFLAQPLPATAHPTYGPTLAMRAGLKQLLVAQTNADARLSIVPGSGNRALLDGALAFGIIDSTDYAGLMARARPDWTDLTSGQIDTVRAEMAVEAARQSRSDAAQTEISKSTAYIGALESWIVNGGTKPVWSIE